MAQKHDKEAIIEPKLCIKCTEMYGNPNFDDMCSLCFKYPFPHIGSKKQNRKFKNKKN